MDFGANKTPVDVIKEGAFRGTQFKDIYFGVTEKWYKKSWKEFDQLKDIDQKFCLDYYDVSVNKFVVKCGTLLRFWENKGWINEIDPYGWFQLYFRYCLGRMSEDDARQVNRWKNIVSRFTGKLVKMIKDVGGKYNDYSIAPKIRQILLHWGYELTETICFIDLTKKCIKMNYYWFNSEETLQKAKEKYSKEIAEYYLENKEAIKENSKNRYKNFSSKRQD